MAPLTPRTEASRQAASGKRQAASGKRVTFTEIAGHQAFARDRAGTQDRRPALFLHRDPSSSYAWRHAFATLDGSRLVAFDFVGYADNPREQRVRRPIAERDFEKMPPS